MQTRGIKVMCEQVLGTDLFTTHNSWGWFRLRFSHGYLGPNDLSYHLLLPKMHINRHLGAGMELGLTRFFNVVVYVCPEQCPTTILNG